MKKSLKLGTNIGVYFSAHVENSHEVIYYDDDKKPILFTQNQAKKNRIDWLVYQ